MGLSRHGPLARFAVAVLAILLLGVQLPTFLQPTFGTRSPPPRGRSRRGADVDAKPREANVLSLSVLIVGAGPAGLLLADRLLSAGCSVHLVESRADPRAGSLEGRAYALGLGIRAQRAIRTVGDRLWETIKPSGFASERFKLHISPTFAIDLRTPEDNNGLEPSLLIYQSDLCSAMLDHLESNFESTGRLKISFESRLKSLDTSTGVAQLQSDKDVHELPAADLVAGCDGVNSVVRSSIAAACPGFEVTQTKLPGSFKVLRFPEMPSKLDPTAVHAIPGKGSSSAFVEPTARGACALINWREGVDTKPLPNLGQLDDAEKAREALVAYFPLIEDALGEDAGQQFVNQKASQASTVKCNTYHFGRAVLLGDAAHCTGGVSGQGCSSAMKDSVVLAELLLREVGSGHSVAETLALYSRQQVPEGHALLDLSLGPSEEVGPVRKALYGAASFAGTILSKVGIGDPPLQTLLTTCLTPFAEIRRDRDFFFGDFPKQKDFDEMISKVSS